MTSYSISPQTANADNRLSILVHVALAVLLAMLLYVLAEPLNQLMIIMCLLLLATRLSLLILLRPTHKLHQTLNSTLAKNIGAIVFSIAIVASLRHDGLINAMVNLLMSGATLWWFTLPAVLNQTVPQHRIDVQNLSLCLFFLVSSGFIYDQTLLFSLIFFSHILLTWLVLLIFDNRDLPIKTSLKQYARFTAICLPITTLLFLLLPNLSPFWQLPKQQQNQTGLSDKMTPGDVAQLAQSNRLAYRVAFNGPNPEHKSMYWRSLTMANFDGKTWSAETHLETDHSEASQAQPPIQPYNVIAEPSYQPWLITLSSSRSTTANTVKLTDDTLIYNTDLTAKFKYSGFVTVTSSPIRKGEQPNYFVSQKIASLSPFKQRKYQALPSEHHPQTQQLVEQWRQQISKFGGSKQRQATRFVDKITGHFQQHQFLYTLEPAKLNGDHIDDFMFRSQQGFCAHFASAAAVMLRLYGLPARVVAGYQGGEYNPNGNYFNIYDSAAHAWVEYWLAPSEVNQKGVWIRFDPTAAVAPTRITDGLDRNAILGQTLATQPIELIKSFPLLNAIRQQLQSLDYYWTVWVLDFDPNRKSNRLAHWFNQVSAFQFVSVVSILVFAAALLWWQLFRVHQPLRHVDVLLKMLQKDLLRYEQTQGKKVTNRLLMQRARYQSLREYQQTLTEQYPQFAGSFDKLFSHLERHLYRDSGKDPKAFRRKWQKLLKQGLFVS